MDASSPRIHRSPLVGNNNPCPVSFGQVAAQTRNFSRSESLPASFGKYDSFYLSLRNSGTETRQQQQKQWMRRHQYRGDENVKENLSSWRRKNERRNKKFNSMAMFSTPEKMKDVYEDDFIEADRGCVVGYASDVRGIDVTTVQDQIVTDCHNSESKQSSHDQPVSCRPNQVSPLIPSHEMTADPNPNTPNNGQNLHLQTRKHTLSPITHGLDDAFMKMTLQMNHSIVTPCERLCTENQWEMTSERAENTSAPSSSVDPVVHSQNSSISSYCINNQPESLAQDHSAPLEVLCPTHVKATQSVKSSPINSPPQRHSISTNQLKLTPLSQAILTRGRFSTGTKNLALSSFHTKTTTVTPKRKPRGTITSASKRRKTESHGSTIGETSAGVPRPLYNGRAMERIRHVRKCTDGHCRWNPNLHSRKAACERCWTLASDLERQSFIDNGGRHLRIALVKGGCPSSCKLFSNRSKRSASDENNLFDDEDVRLCRKCFDDMHHVGVRQL